MNTESFDMTVLNLEAKGLIALKWDDDLNDYIVEITDHGREVLSDMQRQQ